MKKIKHVGYIAGSCVLAGFFLTVGHAACLFVINVAVSSYYGI